MRVLFATSELYPFVKTGGLGDVAAGMPYAMQKLGVDIRYFLPGYTEIKQELKQKKTVHSFANLFGQTDAKVISGMLPNGLKAYVLDAPGFFERPHPYLNEDGKDWPDNHLRFGAFSYAAAQLSVYEKSWRPEIIHGNDWQCGLIPLYQSEKAKAATVLTIHNLGYQGLFPPTVMNALSLPSEKFTVEGFEFYGKIGFLKAGLFYSDRLTAVSPTYANEICTPEMGCGLEGLLSTRRNNLTGILNGIDTMVWDPQTDPLVKYSYNAKALATKKKNKKALLQEIGLNDREKAPLFAFISRLTPQKGVDILLDAIRPLLVQQDITLFIVGNGDADLEQHCRTLAQEYPDRVAIYMGYDEELAHRLQAGADAVIVPSLFEPCGLVQMYALRYGALPIVRRTGGLADSVSTETGFLFDAANAEDLQKTLLQAIDLYKSAPKSWQKIQKKAMAEDLTWDNAAKKYRELYDSMLK